jgi:formylglycine-generating enzyme required for sulfatase activity
MVVVPAGSFLMGSPPSEVGNSSNEGPQHPVTIARSFAVGKFEVTFDEWDACVVAGGCRHRPFDADWGRGRRPVINVSWEHATNEYLPWLSRKTGKSYRLLTEAEWEYAARAGTTTKYAVGDTISKGQAQYSEGTWGTAGRTVPVGSFPPNRFGLHDMHGNVQEWVQDCWNESYYGAPSDGSARMSGDCRSRTLRGGTWDFVANSVRSGVRVPLSAGGYGTFNGFRVARTL